MAEKGDHRPKAARKKSRKKTNKKGDPSRKNDTGKEVAKAKKVYHLLTELFRDLVLGGEKGGRGDRRLKEEIPFAYHPHDDPATFSRRLLDTLLAKRDAMETPSSFSEGSVFCYNCESPSCRHARPPNPRSVFAGYTATGFPLWTEFYSAVLDAGAEKIDDLFQETPEIVALCQDREGLIAEQLQVFGKASGRYDIWGQIVVGYLPLPHNHGLDRSALTLQAVRCAAGDRVCLRLNPIGKGPGQENVGPLLMTDPELGGLLSVARQKLEELERKMRAPRSASKNAISPETVMPVLRRLARGIEGTFRRRRRRTQHAMDRRRSRPAVGLAQKDANKVTPERFLYDEQHHTFIVLGPKWRVHVFGQDGRHITSMVLDKEGVQKRLDLRRWRYASPEERDGFKAKVTTGDGRSLSGG
jgi:hypothetical protein